MLFERSRLNRTFVSRYLSSFAMNTVRNYKKYHLFAILNNKTLSYKIFIMLIYSGNFVYPFFSFGMEKGRRNASVCVLTHMFNIYVNITSDT